MKSHATLLFAAIAIPLTAAADAQELPADGLAYTDAVTVGAPTPRYCEIETGLPEGISWETLLSEVDPNQQSPWQFGWIAYGESNSRSVAVGLRQGSGLQLFVDVDRNKRFSKDERIASDVSNPNRWLLKLDAEFLSEDNEYLHVRRSVILRISDNFLQLATAGVMKGFVSAGDQWMLAVRIDRDANGRWFDANDRILLDTNADGKVNAIGGRISCDSICRLGGRRYVLQSDLQGESLSFVELKGAGKVVPRITLLDSQATISEITGVLVSKSGVRVTIHNLDQTVDCPVGEYRVEALSFQVATKRLNYWFRFSASPSAKPQVSVSDGVTIELDLLGKLTLHSHQTASATETTLQITPTFNTSNGLYLTGSRTGRTTPTLENRLLMQSVNAGKVIDNNSTGFS